MRLQDWCQLVICYLVLINIVPLNTLTKVRKGLNFYGWTGNKAPRAQIIALLLSGQSRENVSFISVSGIGTKRPAPWGTITADGVAHVTSGLVPSLGPRDVILDSLWRTASHHGSGSEPPFSEGRSTSPAALGAVAGFSQWPTSQVAQSRTCVGVADTNTTATFSPWLNPASRSLDNIVTHSCGLDSTSTCRQHCVAVARMHISPPGYSRHIIKRRHGWIKLEGMISSQAKLIFLCKPKAQITCAVKHEEKVSEES